MAVNDISMITFGSNSYNLKDPSKIPATQKGTANGVAELDGTGKVPSSQLPSYASADALSTQASIDASGLITFKNSSGTALFTLQLPLYNGGVV